VDLTKVVEASMLWNGGLTKPLWTTVCLHVRDRAESSPPQAFLTSQILTLCCGRASPDSVE
jgi:hypothetical protein